MINNFRTLGSKIIQNKQQKWLQVVRHDFWVAYQHAESTWQQYSLDVLSTTLFFWQNIVSIYNQHDLNDWLYREFSGRLAP